jgi:glycosyltransferase involved in cell wall biosynthesis
VGFKVLHLIDSGGLYGAEKMLLTLVTEQLKQGLEPMILSAGLPGEVEKALDKEARALDLPVIQWPMKAGLNFREGLQIARWAEKEHFGLLHSHGYKFDILLGLMPKRLRRLPMVATTHGYTHKKLFSKMGLYSIIDRLALFFVEMAVVVSPNQRVLKLGPFRRSRVVIENGIETEPSPHEAAAQEAAVQPAKEEGVFRICAVGRLSEEKGFDLLISAVAQLRNKGYPIHLSIAGEGPERQQLEMQVQALNIKGSVDFSGYISDVAKLFSQSDLFVISSHTEGLPITLLEAMNANIPILATSVGAISAVLGEGEFGVLVEPGSVQSIEYGISQCMKRSSQEATVMAQNARRELLEKYSSRVMADKYTERYKSIVVA